MSQVLRKFISYVGLKWLFIYIAMFVGSPIRLATFTLEGHYSLAILLLIMPFLEMVLLYPVFKKALKETGIAKLFTLIIAFSLELLFVSLMTGAQPADWIVLQLPLSIVLFCLLYRNSQVQIEE